MDKNVLKKFAIESRQELMEKVANKINRYFVDEEFNVNQNGEVYVLVNDKHTLRLTKSEYENRQLLVKRIKEITLEQVIEEAAYTWFNRIIAIRYMEIHDYLPLTKDNQSLGVRGLSSKDNTPDPEIMKISNLINSDLDIEFNKEYYGSIQDNNKRFEYILLLVCQKLGKVIPQVFDGITDYIDILIPDNLLNDSGYITKLLKEVPVDNFEQVEIIGWLYQYYNQTEKDRVISAKKAYKKNEIPYATQLFTPDWIVKYMVENSLGRYWIEHGGNIDLIKNWKYFIKDNLNLEEKPLTVADVNNMTVKELINTPVKKLVKLDPKNIKCIDPCSGSGHILVYMFEVLYQIYESYGYSKNDISELILKNNLYGLDIDDRAGQLSILSVLLKAREYDKEIFNKDIVRNLNVMSIQESNTIQDNIIENINNDDARENAKYLIDNFKNAKEIGSLLILENENYDSLDNDIKENETIFGFELKEKMIPLIKIANILSNKYDVVVTNPPYMGSSNMNNVLKTYLKKNYNDSKSDLCTAFMETRLLKNNAYMAMINQHSWMFLTSFDKLRNKIINSKDIVSLIHLGTRAFKEISGEVVQTTSFVIKNTNENRDGIYIRLIEYKDPDLKEEKMLNIINEKKDNYFITNNNKFINIPRNIIAYWVSDSFIKNFKNNKMCNYATQKVRISTGNNDRFVRVWYEVDINKIFFPNKWVIFNKGGEYRRWYGNLNLLINYEFNGKELRLYNGYQKSDENFYFKKGITYSDVSMGNVSFRYLPEGSISDSSGPMLTVFDKNNIYKLLGVVNTKPFQKYASMLSPTIHYNWGSLAEIPIFLKDNTENMVNENISISKDDWDSFETSWDFTGHPLLKNRNLEISDRIYNEQRLSQIYTKWEEECNKRFNKLKQNEEELNRIYIDIYGMQDELTPEVEEKDITVRKADRVREIKSLISYAVGCMFGRYSLDEEGLIYAGGEFNKDIYKTFEADTDNIIPIMEENYFGDDIVSRFKKFIEVVYGKETLYENLDFIADTLGKRNGENSEETIRRYFINDFYNDHVKMYQKRPIYWLFDSGKKNGFKCLIYMHRYNEGIVSKIRLDYLHRMQNTYEKELKEITDRFNNDIDLTSKRELSKKQADLSAKLQETNEYDEKIAHIADKKIKIELDDGVVVNYAKFSVKNPKTGKEESILANSKDIVKKKKDE